MNNLKTVKNQNHNQIKYNIQKLEITEYGEVILWDSLCHFQLKDKEKVLVEFL